jgi:hypothetical protein
VVLGRWASEETVKHHFSFFCFFLINSSVDKEKFCEWKKARRKNLCGRLLLC